MPSPKRKKKKSAPAHNVEPPAAEPQPTGKPLTSKSKVASLLALSPHHPLWAELNDPENEGCIWLVEFVNPPGIFMARAVPEPEDAEAIHEAMRASYQALRTGSPVMTRYTLGTGYSGGHARRLVECIARFHPEPKVPFSVSEINEIHGTFRVVQ